MEKGERCRRGKVIGKRSRKAGEEREKENAGEEMGTHEMGGRIYRGKY